MDYTKRVLRFVKFRDKEFHNLILKFLINLKELESWDFKFATTPKFQLDINMGHLRLELTILKGHINKYAIKDLNDNEITELDDSFEQGLCQLINVKLKKNSLLEIFEKYNLIESHENFNFILNYINKNIS